MSEYNFDEFFAYVTGKAVAVFNEFGEHQTILFVQQHDQGDWVGIPLPWSSPEEKERMHRQLAFTYRKRPANAYVMVCEAWAVQRKLGDLAVGPVINEPDRMEILAVHGGALSGARKAKVWFIERDGEAVTLRADNEERPDTLEAALDRILLHQPTANMEMQARAGKSRN